MLIYWHVRINLGVIWMYRYLLKSYKWQKTYLLSLIFNYLLQICLIELIVRQYFLSWTVPFRVLGPSVKYFGLFFVGYFKHIEHSVSTSKTTRCWGFLPLWWLPVACLTWFKSWDALDFTSVLTEVSTTLFQKHSSIHLKMPPVKKLQENELGSQKYKSLLRFIKLFVCFFYYYTLPPLIMSRALTKLRY